MKRIELFNNIHTAFAVYSPVASPRFLGNFRNWFFGLAATNLSLKGSYQAA